MIEFVVGGSKMLGVVLGFCLSRWVDGGVIYSRGSLGGGVGLGRRGYYSGDVEFEIVT